MNDKSQKLYDLYLSQGLITESTSFDRFSSATPDQQEKLYELGKSKGLFKSATVDDFKSAFQPQEELTEEMMETGQRNAAPAYAMTEEKYAAEKKKDGESPSQDGVSVGVEAEIPPTQTADFATYEQEIEVSAPLLTQEDRSLIDPEFEEYDIEKSTQAEIEKARLEDEKIKSERAMASAVGREQGKIVSALTGTTDDAIMPNADIAISEKIDEGIKKKKEETRDSGAKMMYGWRGEDNYYANLYLNYLDEISPNKANDLRSRIKNDSEYFNKRRGDLKAPSSELVAQGFNIAMTVGHDNFEKAANKAESIIEEIEGLKPEMQIHQDRIKDGAYNGTEEQLSEYIALAKKADGLLSLPQIESMQKAEDDLERIKNDYKNSADVNILSYYEEVKRNNQITTDRAYRKNNAILDVVIPITDAITKGGIGTVASIADFANNLNMDNEWGLSDDVASYVRSIADTYEVYNPTPTKFAREMFEQVAVIDGYEVVLKGGKPTGQVFAPNGYLATEEDSDKYLTEYSANPDEYDTEESFNFRAGLYTSTAVGADMLMGLIPIGGGVSKIAKVAGMSTKLAGAVGVSTAVIVQSQNDFYQAAKEAGATDQEAAALGFVQAGVIALVALINPIEAKALMTITGASRKKLISQYVKELASGVPRKTVIENFGKAAVAKALVKKGKTVGWEMLKEGAEETLEIPANAAVAKAWDYLGGVNTQTETDVHDVLNTFATAGLGSLPFALIGGSGGSSRSRQELMYAATTDLDATRALLRKSIGKEITTETGEKIVINDDYINKHIAQLEELKKVGSIYFSNKNITEEDKVSVTSLIADKKSLEEASKVGGDVVKNANKAKIEAIDEALGLYLNKEKGQPFYTVQGLAITKEQLEERMANPEWVKGFKAGRWSLKVSNDKETENKLATIYNSKDTSKAEEPVTEDVVTEEKPTPRVFETPTDEKYAVVNEGKGEGDRVLTKTEYDEYVAPAEGVAEEAAPTETPTEVVAEKVEEVSEQEVVETTEEVAEEVTVKKKDEVQTGKPLKIRYNKNPQKAPDMGAEFGQDVEASGDYVTQKVSDFTPEGLETGVVESENPLVIDITDDTQISYKNELSQRYDGKVGEELSEAIRQDGYDAIVTKYDDGSTGEIVLLKEQRDAIQESSTEEVDVQEPARDSREVGEGDVRDTAEEVDTQDQSPEAEAQVKQEADDLADALGLDDDVKFQLETEMTDKQRKDKLEKEADDLMNEVQPENVTTVSEPTMEPIPIEVTENKELSDKVPKMSVMDLVGKVVNYVMADRLKVSDKYSGGPFFPLMADKFGKVAWASIDIKAAKEIVRGAIKGDYSVVYNMKETAVDSNRAVLDEMISKIDESKDSNKIFSEFTEYLKSVTFADKTAEVHRIANESKSFSEFADAMLGLDVDTRSAIVKKALPSEYISPKTEIGILLKKNGITQESIRESLSEQFTFNVPMGGVTMVLEVTDSNGNKITSLENIDDAIMTPKQQDAEGVKRHPNYPYMIRGRVVAMLKDTVPFWSLDKEVGGVIDKKLTGVIKKKLPEAQAKKKGEKTRQTTSSEARSDAMRQRMGAASQARTVSLPTPTVYQRFIGRLSKAFPSVEVVTSQAEFDALIRDANAKKLVTSNQKVYGAVYDGKLYLNPAVENFNTPIHEFGHVWLNVAKELGKDTYKKGMALMTEDSPYYKQVINSKEYGKIIDKMRKDGVSEADIETYIKEEALATAIGDKGESFTSAAQNKNFKNWLNELFEFIGKLTGISELTPDQLQNINLDEFVQGVVVDIMSENEVFAGAEVKSFGEQLQLMTVPEDSMTKIIEFGRAENFSDASIKELLKKRGFKVADINNAMVVDIDLFTKLPLEFNRVEGGVQEAQNLFNDVRNDLKKFANKKRKDGTTPTSSEVRAKAIELLREHPVFKAQKEGVQLILVSSFDKSLGTSANKSTQREVNAIKNLIKQRKKGVRSIKEAQRDLRKALKGLPMSKEVKSIIKAVGDINEYNALAVIEKISEAVDKIQAKEAAVDQQKKALKDVVKELKSEAKHLDTVKKTIARFMRKSLPVSDSYSKSQLSKAVGIIANINAKNYVSEAMKALDIVEQQREKIKSNIVKSMLKMAQNKAKKERGQSTKPKSKGLDAQGQAFFQEAAKILKLVYKNDFDGMIKLAQELSDLSEIDSIITKEQRGEKLSIKEQAMLDRVAAFDTFGDLMGMSLEEVINIDQALKDVRKESIARLKANRLKRAQEMEALSKDSMSQIKKGFKELFTIKGILKSKPQLIASAMSIREAFKRDGFTKGVKALYDNMGLTNVNPVAWAKNMVKENMLHLGTISALLDKGGTFFNDNIYKPLNLMDEAKRKGYREQIKKLDDIANSIKGIKKGYKEIREMLGDGKLFIEGLDAEGVDAEIESIKNDLKDNNLDIDNAKRRLSALVKSRMELMGMSSKTIKQQIGLINGQTDVDALVDSTIQYIEDVSTGYVIKGMTLTKNAMLRVYALSKNPVQREKMRRQGLTDENLDKIEAFLGPELLEFADGVVNHLSTNYFESVNDVYVKTNDVNLDYIENYFPTKSLSQPREEAFDADSFESKFNAESPSALKKRVDEKSGVDLSYTFTSELESHLDSMERFKAYAEGVRKISKILALPQVSTLLKESGFSKTVNLIIDNAVNPYTVETTAVGKLLNKFYGIALGLRWMQLPKQATSFVNAYSQYSLGKEGSKTKKAGALGPDFLGFAYDMASMILMLRTNFKKARSMSATFNERVMDALEGNVAALESGIEDQKFRSGFGKWWNVAKASPTTMGDIAGVLGYMAVYNRNIKNGMSEAKALELFNDYNKTQQTRRGTELSSLQVNAKKQPMLRLLTAFSSTLILQLNEIIASSANIQRDIANKKTPKKSDVRSVYLNMGISNVLFVATANMFKLMLGNDDDEEEVLGEMKKAMFMFNQISKIPEFGAAFADQINKLEGNAWKSSGPISPASDMVNDIAKAIKKEDLLEGVIVASEIASGTNLDIVRGGVHITKEGLDSEAFYEIFGVSSSYRPNSSNKEEKKDKKDTSYEKLLKTIPSEKKKNTNDPFSYPEF